MKSKAVTEVSSHSAFVILGAQFKNGVSVCSDVASSNPGHGATSLEVIGY